jgi:hypothetical protein
MIIGTQVSRNGTEPETIRLEQQPDGLHWQVQRSSGSEELRTEDSRKLQRKARGGGIVFQACIASTGRYQTRQPTNMSA